jgi:hypothetical protein
MVLYQLSVLKFDAMERSMTSPGLLVLSRVKL